MRNNGTDNSRRPMSGGEQSRRVPEGLSGVVPQGCEYVETVRVSQGDSDEDIVVLVVQGTPCPSKKAMQTRYQLTPRETEVARLLSRRLSSREIAEHLYISVNTARRHSERVLQKMGLKRRSAVKDALLRLYRQTEPEP